MLFDEVVRAATEVGATRSRLAKASALRTLLTALEEAEIVPTVGLLLGKPRQGRIGVGWRTLQNALPDPAGTATLTIGDVDAAFTALADSLGTGTGSSVVRSGILQQLLAAATADEQELLGRMITGEVRTGALEGLLLDAIAAASDLPGDQVRRRRCSPAISGRQPAGPSPASACRTSG